MQEALVRALRAWPMRGVPDDPAAWLLLVARNYAIDELRKHSRARDARQALERARDIDAASVASISHFASELDDDELALMFLCCDPDIERSTRVALTLKIASGFSTAEIARAFFLQTGDGRATDRPGQTAAHRPGEQADPARPERATPATRRSARHALSGIQRGLYPSR